jgi:hypothetical protein
VRGGNNAVPLPRTAQQLQAEKFDKCDLKKLRIPRSKRNETIA